ncbi:hypothetical protein AB833_04490 [Chromatiales bacterium (ex Bugula neritina AB1)]|nr:hypothetical protein AB833_04490 [Chromatiales bacterium (ex Bugula neritina AB1)]
MLVCLCLSRKGQVDREQIATSLWPNTDSQKAKSNLRQALFRLRRELEKFQHDHILQTKRNTISLDQGFLELDTDVVIQKILSGEEVPLHTEITELEESFLVGLELENEALVDWVRFVRADFSARLHTALRELLGSEKSNGSRLEAAQCLLEFDPADEEACRYAMQRYFDLGESAKALRCYSGLWVALANEFDVEPSEKTQEIAVQIKTNASVDEFETSPDPLLDEVTQISTAETTDERIPLRGIEVDSLITGDSSRVYLFWYFSQGSQDLGIESGDSFDTARYAIEEVVGDFTVSRIKSFSKDEYFLEFESGIRALECAFAILRVQPQIYIAGKSRSASPKMSIVGHIGSAENSLVIAIRLAAWSTGSDIVVTTTVRDQITASVDARVVDLGELSIADYNNGVRAFRLRENCAPINLDLNEVLLRTVARLAIIPLEARCIVVDHDRLIGEIVADELIHLASIDGRFDVISRQSTKAFCGRDSSVLLAGSILDCDFVVGGHFSIIGNDLQVHVELSEGNAGVVIFSERYGIKGYRQSLERVTKCGEILADLYAAVGKYSVKQLRAKAPVNLESHKLLAAAANMMNRFGSRDFFLARKALEVVIIRNPHWAPAHAMLAEWRVMRAQQGWMVDRTREGMLAGDAAARALDCDPECSAAHVADGVVQLHFFQRIDIAQKRYDSAIVLDNNNCLAWFSRSVLLSFSQRGELAVSDAMRAIKLSPVDPSSYLYQSAIASAYLAKNDAVTALEWVERSLLLNRLHGSSLRMRVIANWRLGKENNAKKYTRELLELYPDFSITKYKQYAPVSESKLLRDNVTILKLAGVPD